MAAQRRETPHVLVVDDDPGVRGLASSALRLAGYHVTEAAGVCEGLGILERAVPDVVLTDLRMPDGSGHEILRHAGKLPTAPPVIVMSGTFDSSTQPELLLPGAAALLPKPFRLHDLIAAITTALGV